MPFDRLPSPPSRLRPAGRAPGNDENAPYRSPRQQGGGRPPAGTTHQSPLTAEYEHDYDCEHEGIFEAATHAATRHPETMKTQELGRLTSPGGGPRRTGPLTTQHSQPITSTRYECEHEALSERS